MATNAEKDHEKNPIKRFLKIIGPGFIAGASGADIGAVAAAINMFVPIPIPAMILPISVIIVAFQILGSYRLIERIFKWLTLALLAYIATAFYAHPNAGEALSASFIPRFSFDAKSLATIIAIFGTSC